MREISQDICEEIPEDQKKDCYSESEEISLDNFAEICARGSGKGLESFAMSIKKLLTDVKDWSFQNRRFRIKAVNQAQKICATDLGVLRLSRQLELVQKNTSDSEAIQLSMRQLNSAYANCVRRETQKENPFTIDLSLPELDQIRPLYICLNHRAQAELACSVIVPGLATSLAGSALLKMGKDFIRGRRFKKNVNDSIEKRIEKIKEEKVLTPAEIESLKHQEDLLSFARSPGVAEVLEQNRVDLKPFVEGIIDSDLGKLKKFRALLETASAESDFLLEGLQLRGKSRSQQALRQLAEKHWEGKPLIDPPVEVPPDLKRLLESPDLKNSQLGNDRLAQLKSQRIREVFQQVPSGPALFHDWPGLLKAMWDFEKDPSISFAQFEERVLTNLNHNSFGQGFGVNVLIPKFESSLRQKGFSDFLEGSYYAGPVMEGLTKVNYGMPLSLSGIIHTVADRVSGATGGPVKFIYEMAGPQIRRFDDPIPFGKLNLFGKNGLESLRDLLHDGPGGNPFGSNATTTLQQINALEKYTKSAQFLSSIERSSAIKLIQAGKLRIAAFQSFSQPPNIEYFEVAGKLDRIIFRSPIEKGGGYIGVITKDTPQHEAVEIFQKFQKEERRINRDPMSQLLKSRILSKSELIQVGLPVGSTYAYCGLANISSRKSHELFLHPTVGSR
ncbi:MAG: hypothetical protein WCH11_01505 [Bdellovibrio sp.]